MGSKKEDRTWCSKKSTIQVGGPEETFQRVSEVKTRSGMWPGSRQEGHTMGLESSVPKQVEAKAKFGSSWGIRKVLEAGIQA